MLSRVFFASLIGYLSVLAPRLAAQGSFPFQLRLQQGTTIVPILNSATATLSATNVGQDVTMTLTVIYRGATQATLSQPEIVGAPEITFVNLPGIPAVLSPNGQVDFSIRYRSNSSSRVVAQASLNFSEAGVPPSPGAPPPPGISGQISLTVLGVAPELSVAYALADGNTIALNPGGRLVFPPTPINTTPIATIIILNRGSGSGVVDSAAVSGPATLQSLGLPLFPAAVEPGRELRFSIRYSPRQVESITASLQITLGGRASTFTIEASATGASFAYELLDEGGAATPIVPNQNVPLRDTRIGTRTNVAVRVRNSGNGDGVIPSITIFGAGFQLVDPPLGVQTLTPGASLVIAIAFVPTLPGTVTGRLRVGNDSFELTAAGVGPRLNFSYIVAGTQVSILPGTTLLFSPTQVGLTTTREFVIQNSGNATATIASIDVSAGTQPPFTLSAQPALPLSLAPDESVRIQIQFSPLALGVSSGTLRVDELTFVLSGSAAAPPAVAGYRIDGPSGVQAPLQQPAIGLTLDAPYPLRLTGVLTLQVIPDGFAIDSSVQFSTGGRIVDFSIPANSTRAVFAGGANQVRFQTGSAAGTIVITPTFTTSTGIALTADSGSPLQVTIVPAAPRLLSLNISARAAATFTLQITGYSTTRTLSQLSLEFARSSGAAIPITINLEAAAATWYRSPTSFAFGGLFSATIPFLIQNGPIDGLTAIRAISATVSNERGSSNSLSIEVR